MSIEAFDLNLLLVLNTVLEERNVARAARRLHVTPSAVSNALARLRGVLRDPLVTRKGRGIVPTPRAVELAPAIARGLREFELAVVTLPFDAVSCTRTFTLAVADAGQITWVPRIVQAMRREMPRARLRVVGIDSLVSLGDLASSEIDLHLGVKATGVGVHSEPLLDERTVLVARDGHRALRKRLSREALGALEHVRVEMLPGRNLVDQLGVTYERAGVPRVVVVSVPSFTAAVAVVSATDLVTTVPESVLSAHPKLRAVVGPVPAHGVKLSMCWHERTHGDSAAIAFRNLVRSQITK